MFLLVVAENKYELWERQARQRGHQCHFVFSGSTYAPSLRETVTCGWSREKAKAVV